VAHTSFRLRCTPDIDPNKLYYPECGAVLP